MGFVKRESGHQSHPCFRECGRITQEKVSCLSRRARSASCCVLSSKELGMRKAGGNPTLDTPPREGLLPLPVMWILIFLLFICPFVYFGLFFTWHWVWGSFTNVPNNEKVKTKCNTIWCNTKWLWRFLFLLLSTLGLYKQENQDNFGESSRPHKFLFSVSQSSAKVTRKDFSQGWKLHEKTIVDKKFQLIFWKLEVDGDVTATKASYQWSTAECLPRGLWERLQPLCSPRDPKDWSLGKPGSQSGADLGNWAGGRHWSLDTEQF